MASLLSRSLTRWVWLLCVLLLSAPTLSVSARDGGGPSGWLQSIASYRGGEKTPGSGPLWSRTRTMSARKNALAHWQKHGREFPEYHSAQAYIEGAHQFMNAPPKGTLTKSRPNGDTLYYHPESNTFGVQARNGAPRTMFRPNNGLAYWNRQ